jgi:hypothetical protein
VWLGSVACLHELNSRFGRDFVAGRMRYILRLPESLANI